MVASTHTHVAVWTVCCALCVAGIQEFSEDDSFGAVVNSIMVGLAGVSSVFSEAGKGSYLFVVLPKIIGFLYIVFSVQYYTTL